MIEKYISTLTTALSAELPGFQAQQRMLALPRKLVDLPNSPETATAAAVLILLYQTGSDIHFYLTERTHSVENHKGQISLPGGVQENNETLPDTARRETWEEIGVPVNSIHIIGKLTPLYVPITSFMINPFVGWTNPEPPTKPDPCEVNKLISVSMTSLINDKLEENEVRQIRGYEVLVPYFRFGQDKVWGATAMILAEFKLILKSVEDGRI